jgi:hypothetical protein
LIQNYGRVVLRLFSMFPAGAAGFGLLLLRISVAVMLVTVEFPNGVMPGSTWHVVGVAVLSALICLGLFTPASCAICSVIELISLCRVNRSGVLHVIVASVVATALSLLGPGAFSIDARLFGRRIIIPSPEQRSP